MDFKQAEEVNLEVQKACRYVHSGLLWAGKERPYYCCLCNQINGTTFKIKIQNENLKIAIQNLKKHI